MSPQPPVVRKLSARILVVGEWWPAAILLMACLAGCAAEIVHRWHPSASIDVLLGVLAFIALAGMPALRLCDRSAQLFMLLAVGLMLWMALVQGLVPDALPCGWWRWCERGAAISFALVVLTRLTDPGRFCRIMGSSAALVLVIIALGNAAQGFFVVSDIRCVAFGHINAVVNVATPALLAATVLLVATRSRLSGSALIRWGEWMLIAGGWLALALIVMGTHRRGVILAVGAGVGWLAWRRVWEWRRGIAIVVAIAAVAAVVYVVVAKFSAEVPAMRDERISIYKAAWDAVMTRPLAGWGHYGALHMQWIEGENARTLIAGGHFPYHPHNEFLDAWLDGGIPAVVMLSALLAIVAWRSLNVRDPALRAAWQGMLAATAVPLLLDNFLGLGIGQAWLWIACAAVVATPVAGERDRAWRWLPTPRLVAGIFAVPAFVVALLHLSFACLPRDAPAGRLLIAARLTANPQSLTAIADAFDSFKDRPADRMVSERMVSLAITRLGSSGRLPFSAAEAALAGSRNEEALDWLLRALSQQPFSEWAYFRLGALLDRHPDLVGRVPPVVLHRLALARGAPQAIPWPGERRGIEAAVDTYALVRWQAANGLPWPQVSPGLEMLARSWAHVPDVANLILKAVIFAPPGSFPWLAGYLDRIEIGARRSSVFLLAVKEVQSPQEAQSIWPILERWFPLESAACREGRDHSIGDPELVAALHRIWGLRQALLPPQ